MDSHFVDSIMDNYYFEVPLQIIKVKGGVVQLNLNKVLGNQPKVNGDNKKLYKKIVDPYLAKTLTYIDYPVKVNFLVWLVTPTADIDNTTPACKFLLDSMQTSGVLLNDNQNIIKNVNFQYMGKVAKRFNGDYGRCLVNIERINCSKVDFFGFAKSKKARLVDEFRVEPKVRKYRNNSRNGAKKPK